MTLKSVRGVKYTLRGLGKSRKNHDMAIMTLPQHKFFRKQLFNPGAAWRLLFNNHDFQNIVCLLMIHSNEIYAAGE